MRDQDIERLFAEHAQSLYAFAVYRTGDATAAEEIVGDTFERVVRARRGFDSRKGNQQAWIYTIALNLVRDHLRRTAAGRRAMDQVLADHRAAEDDDALRCVEDRDLVLRALDELEPDEREIVALRYGADLRIKDIATLTGLPLSTAHDVLQRGLRKLQEQLTRQQASELVRRLAASGVDAG